MDWLCSNNRLNTRCSVCILHLCKFGAKGTPASSVVQGKVLRLSSEQESLHSLYLVVITCNCNVVEHALLCLVVAYHYFSLE